MAQDTMHTVMPKKLAQALMDAGMKHFDAGGIAGAFGAANTVQGQAPAITTQNFTPAINNLQNQQGDVYGQQQSLANQLLSQSQGQGPNPAQAALNQSTGQNVATQGALMAGQRGASANPALMARQVAMQGANTQQQAVGQSATLQAQQQLAAQNALAAQQQAMQNQNLQGQSILQGGQAAQNTALTTGGLGAQNITANSAAGNASTAGGIVGGLLGGGGAALGAAFYKGGQVRKMASGGEVNDNLGIANYSAPTQVNPLDNGVNSNAQKSGSSIGSGLVGLGSAGVNGLMGGGEGVSTLGTASPWEVGGGLAGGAGDESLPAIIGGTDSSGIGSGIGNFFADMGSGLTGFTSDAGAGIGGAADAAGAASPEIAAGAAEVAPEVAVAYKGEKVPFSKTLLNGGNVPGKAQVKGNSPKNDTQPTLLSPGEVVLPRSVTQAKDPAAKAAEFMKHLKGAKKPSYDDVASSKKTLEERVKHLEKCMGGRI